MIKEKNFLELGSLCTKIGSGTTPKGGESVYVDKGTSLIRSQNVYNSFFTENGLAYITDEIAENMASVTVFEGDVLLNITGDSVARCCLAPKPFLPARVNQHVMILRPKRDILDSAFLSYYLTSPRMQSILLSLAGSGGTRKALTKAMLERLLIPSLPLEEQRKIASMLSTCDELIENNRRRIQLLEQTARLIYEEWFIRFRFPEHEETKMIDGLPRGWKKGSASDFIDVMSGGTPKTTIPEYWGGSIPFFTPTDAPDNLYVIDTEKSISEKGIENCSSILYSKETVFITARGTVGKLCLASHPMAMNQSCYALKGKADYPFITPYWIFFAMESVVSIIRKNANGAIFDAIIKDTFKNIPLILPSKNLISKFSETVYPILDQTLVLLKQSKKLIEARDLLLPKLMNGEIQV